ncbi:hypothetical protein MBLNU459_g5161t2 [Dothideomycetes sp. NU459]
MYPGGHNTQWVGGPSNHAKSYASLLQEHDSLFHSYEHLTGLPQPEEALKRLRKIASLVKPIMRKRGWQIQVLTEFMPDDARLLGLNINRTYKICVRLRYSHNPGTFLPIEQAVDTMLHELSHIVWGDHDANFHALWDELRGEHEMLLLKGYTGEGFLSRGHKLGGGRVPAPSEMRRLARASAEKRRVLTKGSGQRLGGTPLHHGTDTRQVIAAAAAQRAAINRGCVSGTAQADRLANQAAERTFKTKAEEDDANNRAIAEALFELMEEEEAQKMQGTFTSLPPSDGLTWHPETGLSSVRDENSKNQPFVSEDEQLEWAMQESIKAGQCSTPLPQHQSNPSERPKSETNMQGSRTGLNQRSQRYGGVIDLTQDDDPATEQTPASKQPLASKQTPATKQILAAKQTAPRKSSNPESWTCQICTCINPWQFLACDACSVERPAALSQNIRAAVPKAPIEVLREQQSLGWHCRECAALMEHKWW